MKKWGEAVEISKLCRRYEAKAARGEDVPDILRLCRGNPLYYQHCPPEVSEENIREDMVKLPPNKDKEDKFYLCLWEKKRLVAVIDLILKYPDEETAFIGFFMVDKDCQGKGVGSFVVGEVLECLKNEFSKVLLGYVRGNEQSRRFWEKNGFVPTGVISKQEQYEIVIMEKILRRSI